MSSRAEGEAGSRRPTELSAVWKLDLAMLVSASAASAGRETGYRILLDPESCEAVVLELVALPTVRRPLRELFSTKFCVVCNAERVGSSAGVLPGRWRLAFKTESGRLIAVTLVT